jgi:hypothetical protein
VDVGGVTRCTEPQPFGVDLGHPDAFETLVDQVRVSAQESGGVFDTA